MSYLLGTALLKERIVGGECLGFYLLELRIDLWGVMFAYFERNWGCLCLLCFNFH